MNALLQRGSIAAAAAIGLLLAGTAPAADNALACPDLATAYRELLRLLPEEHPGRGIDRWGEKGVVADHPMTYGLVLSAEALRFEAEPGDEGRRQIRGTTRWLVANSGLSADGKPGWGVPYDWGERPRNTSYTITTAVVLEGLLDAVRADVGWTADEVNEIVDLMRQVADRWCTDLWMDGQGGGYFCYAGHDKKPCGFYVNAPVMFLGSLARLLHEHGRAIPPDRRELFESRLDALACHARWGTPEQSRRTFEAICDSYGPFPAMRVLPATVGGEATSYPRDNAHVLFGLAHALRQARGGRDEGPR